MPAVNNELPVMVHGQSNLNIEITSDVWSTWTGYKQSHPLKQEACGVLIGSYIESTNSFIIDYCTSPGPGDNRNRASYVMKDKKHQATMNKVFKESDGTSYWLGTWHTHPEAYPTLSTADNNDWQRLIRQNSHEIPAFLFAIIGLKQVSIYPFFSDKFQS